MRIAFGISTRREVDTIAIGRQTNATESLRPRRLDTTWWLALGSGLGLFLVNFMGFVDTETGSALGCGHNWPLCNHQFVPTLWNEHNFFEYTHRVLVVAATVLLVAASVAAWRKYGRWVEVKLFIAIAVGFVVVESIVGAVAVLLPSVSPLILAVTLGISLLSLAANALLIVVLWQIEKSQPSKSSLPTKLRAQALPRHFRAWSVATLTYTFIAMYVGAYVAKSGAGVFFQGYPFPTETPSGPAFALDLLHRSIALGLVLLIIGLLVASYRWRSRRSDLWKGTLVAVCLVVLQALSGALLVLTHLSIPAFLLHVSVVSCLFCTLSYLVLQSVPDRDRTFTRPLTRTPGTGALTKA